MTVCWPPTVCLCTVCLHSHIWTASKTHAHTYTYKKRGKKIKNRALHRGWRNDSGVKNVRCSWRGLAFGSQHPYWIYWKVVAAFNSSSSDSDTSGLQGHLHSDAHAHMGTCIHAYTHTKLEIKVVKTASRERPSTTHLLHPQHCCKLWNSYLPFKMCPNNSAFKEQCDKARNLHAIAIFLWVLNKIWRKIKIAPKHLPTTLSSCARAYH